ncbi:hypothetical protein KCV01_g27487, partial [Aureobasidium melanogenum]
MHFTTFLPVMAFGAALVQAVPADDLVARGAVCVDSDMARVRAAESAPYTFCNNWINAATHTSSPISGLTMKRVSAACQCIVSEAKKAAASSSKASALSVASVSKASASSVLSASRASVSKSKASVASVSKASRISVASVSKASAISRVSAAQAS